MNASANPTNSNESRDPANWSACESGTLGGLNQRMRHTESRRSRGRLAGGALAATAALALVVAMVSGGESALGGITCAQCVAQMPGYELQLTGGESLPAENAKSIASHLQNCSKCRGYFEQRYPGVLATTSTAGLGLISLALLGTQRVQSGRRRG